MTETETCAPLLCQVIWIKGPGYEPGPCGRLARFLITGEDAGGAELYRGMACAATVHQATCRALAWEMYLVVIVKTRLIGKEST